MDTANANAATKATPKNSPKAAPKPAKANPYGSAMAGAFGALSSVLAQDQQQFSRVQLDQIKLAPQIRTDFDTVEFENGLQEMAVTIKKHGVIQPILLRPVAGQLVLVCGERRYRASRIAGMVEIPAIIEEMTDEDAAARQFIENVQRSNLKMIEEAKYLQNRLDDLGGDVQKLSESEGLSLPWLYKRLGLLKLTKQAMRVLTEGISADVEVANLVKAVEKHSPEEAEKLVADLKSNSQRGASDKTKKAARVVASERKDEVLGKKPKAVKAVEKAAKADKAEQPVVELDAALPAQASDKAIDALLTGHLKAAQALGQLSDGEQSDLEDWSKHWAEEAQNSSVDAIFSALRHGHFGTTGMNAYAAAAFVFALENKRAGTALEVLTSMQIS